ncbi:MAG: ABC transporter permease, partial [Gemmatimonadetes bacterium]|nr:ABC transporter permease [Gemmatimonadota bacterium]
MSVWSDVAERLRALVFRSREERELEEEVAFHLEREAARNVRDGMSPEEARRRALLAFGGAERTKEAVRDARGTRGIEEFARDLRHALRQLGRNRGFTAVAVLTLGLGIGASTAVFSVVDVALLRPLPFREPARLVAVGSSPPGGDGGISVARWPAYQEWTESPAFESMGAYMFTFLMVSGGSEPVLTEALGISASLLPTLGVRPVLGRGFTPEDDRPGGPPRVMLDYGLWQRVFGGDPTIVGRTIRVGGAPHEVVGVLPAGFAFPPALHVQNEWMTWRTGVYVNVGTIGGLNEEPKFLVIGRLAPGVTPEAAAAELSTRLAGQAERGLVAQGTSARVESLREQIVAPLRPELLAFLVAVGVVLLVACVNIAALLLARLAAREQELAVRAALGAGRGRIVRQLLTESLVLAAGGGVVGALFAWAGLKALLAAAPAELPRIHEAGVDPRMLAFALGLSLLTGLLCGLAPALRAGRADLRGALASGRGLAGERGTRRAHGVLVALEVGLAVTLLVGGGLLLRSLRELLRVDLGFEARRLLTLDVMLPPDRYPERLDAARFLDEARRRLGALRGVQGVGAIDRLPLGPSFSRTAVWILGRPRPRPGEGPVALNATVAAGYFDAIRIPVVEGRGFNARDGADAPGVVVIQCLINNSEPKPT